MSARRLASAELQPDSFCFSAENKTWAENETTKYPQGRQASAIIALLWRAQKQAGGWLPRLAIEHVADFLGVPHIRALEVATFYTMFNLSPVGRYFIQLCGTTPCGLRGASGLRDVCLKRIGPERRITENGRFSWLEVECLGACCNAPVVQINDLYYEDLSVESFNALLNNLSKENPVLPGSQIEGRTSSHPLHKMTTLLDSSLFDGSMIGAWKKRFNLPKSSPVSSTPAPLEKKTAGATAAQPSSHPKAATAKPVLLKKPSLAKADNLRLLKGLGPNLETSLHKLGVFHFTQIASWTDANLDWLDKNASSLGGRARRNDWVEQAKKLCAEKKS